MPEPLAAVTLDDVLRVSQRYQTSLGEFISDHHLDELLELQLDHLAFKAADAAHYQACKKTLRAKTKSATEAQVQGRPIATFRYLSPIIFGGFGETSLLELMCPKPGKEGEFIGFEHTERVWDDLEAASKYLESKGVQFTHQDNGHHQTLVMVINNHGQELKLTNKGLLQVQAEEAQQGLLTDL